MEEHTPHRSDIAQQFKWLISLVLVFAAVALGAYAYTSVKKTAYLFGGPAVISVTGEGEMVARPDIGTFNFSVRAEAKNPDTAQEASAEAINEITAFLAERSIDKSDIKTTGYNLSPRYEYTNEICERGFCPPGKRELVGYVVHQTIQVKVRDTAAAGTLIAGVGERGATDISGLNFTIDDPEALEAKAREQAISDAKAKAEKLARDLGVRIVRLREFSEGGGLYPHYDYGLEADMAVAESAVLRAAPDIPTGENTITAHVTLIYEIR